jgi:hypothetical protein
LQTPAAYRILSPVSLFRSFPLFICLTLLATPGPLRAQGRLLTDAELDRLQAEMASPTAARRLAAARTVEQADREGFRTYAARLSRALPSQPPIELAVMRRLVFAVWGQYPNPEYPRGPGKDPPMRLSRPEPPPPPIPPGTPRTKRTKPPKPHDPEAADWLLGLAEVDLENDPFVADLPAAEVKVARAEMLLRVALLHALGNSGKQGEREAVAAVFQFAFFAEGLFRDECGRTLRGMGGHAVPTLIRIYNDRTRANAKMRRYASYQLDRMDRLRPAKAISGAPDDVVRSDILRAYGEVLALDAVEAVLEQVGASSHRVRREARWAWLRYVDGPPPPPAPKRKRKLPGGREEAEEKEDYLNYREMAVLALTRTSQGLWNREPDPKLTPRQITDEIFAHYDRLREQQFEQVWNSGKAHEQAGRLAQAVNDFGFILANQPDHPRRGDMASAFERLGEQLAEQAEKSGDQPTLARAIGVLRQALLLRPEGSPAEADGAARLCTRIHLLDARQARRLGGDDRLDLQRADRCDARLAATRLADAKVAAARPYISWRSRLLPWLLVLGGLLLATLATLLGRRRLPPSTSGEAAS